MIADPFHVIAHRGASAYAPENTMAAFRKALELGVPEVETDVRFTKDKRLVLFHDHTLERTTDGTGPPSDHTLEELKQLDAGSWMDPSEYEGFEWREDYSGERLITLEELLDVFGDSFVYHIEIKDRTEGLVAAVIDCTRSRGLIGKVYIYILNEEAHLFEAKQLEPKVFTALAPKRQLEEQGTQAIETVARRGPTTWWSFLRSIIDESLLTLRTV